MEKIQFVAYETMVGALFKKMSHRSENIMHSAIGMIGEAAEIMGAIKKMDDKNLKEELGDFYFYIVAASLTIGRKSQELHSVSYDAPSVVELVIAAGDFLDFAKKQWVYAKTVGDDLLMGTLDYALAVFKNVVTESKFDLDDIIYDNQFKLIGPGGRFEGMVYTDAAAIARADKVEA